jgi:hypothetical protein
VPDIRVGRVHVSANGVSVNDRSPPPTPSEPSLALRVLASQRVPRMALVGLGLLLTLGGLTGLVLSGRLDLESFLLRGGLLIPLGLGVTGVGAALPLVRYWARQEIGRHEAAVHAPAAGQRRRHKGPPNNDCTVPGLVRQTGLALDHVVRTLRWMRDSGEIEEDLDVDRNEFHYSVARGENLDARHDALTRRRSV